MIPEFGHLALILALGLAIALSSLPMIGSYTGHVRLILSAKPLAIGQGFLLSVSFACLAIAFAQDDFTVRYVVTNSNIDLPLPLKISAVWGGHEGSLLLWVLMLGWWTMAVSVFAKALPIYMHSRVLAVMGMISVGFILFTLLTSNPFARYLPNGALEGADLNPLLQDFGLIVHPPTLYMGYVGFSVAFAFAIAALLDGRSDAAWLRWSRPWTLIAWAFLTVGIALGSWWAYYELGWGGWWFWDPVENASFMPWLVGTALIHSLAVSERRGLYKNWTLLLAISAFSLSLLGTFLVRSGVLTSVHAFASDPERGFFLLMLLALTVGGSLLLFAIRASSINSKIQASLWSRETFLLINNLLLVVAATAILIGTLYPILLDAFDGPRISVGPPYFNAVFVPLMVLLIVSLGFGLIAKWKSIILSEVKQLLFRPVVFAILAGLIYPFVYAREFSWQLAMAAALMAWLLGASYADLKRRLGKQTWVSGLRRLNPGYYGMILAHVGIGVMVLGIATVSNYEVNRDIRMIPGDVTSIYDYQFTFVGTKNVVGANYRSVQGVMEVTRDNQPYKVLYPEKRHYNASGQIMTEVALDPGITRDIYVAMGENLGDGAWAIRVHIKPMIRWIWLGAIMMALGALLAVWDKRYRRKRHSQETAYANRTA